MDGIISTLASLHAELLRTYSSEVGLHFQGLRAIASHARRHRRLAASTCKKLQRIDDAYSVARHLTIPSCTKFVSELTAELAGEPKEIFLASVLAEPGPRKAAVSYEVPEVVEDALEAGCNLQPKVCELESMRSRIESLEKGLADATAVNVQCFQFVKDLAKDIPSTMAMAVRHAVSELKVQDFPATELPAEPQLKDHPGQLVPATEPPLSGLQDMGTYVSNEVLALPQDSDADPPFTGATFCGEPLSLREYEELLSDVSESRIDSMRQAGLKGVEFMKAIIQECEEMSIDTCGV